MRFVGGRLAVLALCVQFVLTFGHIHAEEIFGKFGFQAPPQGGIAAVTAPSHRDREIPIPTTGAGLAEAACQICAAMALTAAGIQPDAVRLPLPPVSRIGTVATQHATVRAVRHFLLFQTRAPPVSVSLA